MGVSAADANVRLTTRHSIVLTHRLLIPLTIALLALSCSSREQAPADEMLSVAEFGRDSADRVTATIVNRRWLAERIDLEAATWLRVAETDSASWCGGEIEWCHTVSLRGWWGAPDSLGAPTWTVTLAGIPAGFDRLHRPEFYRIDHPGCCDAQSATSYVSVRTGLVTFRSTGKLLSVYGSGEFIVRRVAFLDTWSALQPVERESNSAVGGVLQYGPPNGPVQRIALVGDTSAPNLRHCCRLDSIGVRASPTSASASELYLSQPQEQLSNGFWIWIRLLPDYESGFVELLVPVRGDSLDLSGARLPRGLRLIAVPEAT